METKKWYQSKTIWANIISLLVIVLKGLDQVYGTDIMSNEMITIVLGCLQGVGLYGRVTAKTTITK